MLSLENVTVNHGARAALHRVTFTAPAGMLTVLAGPNGAGKTTALRAAAGLIAYEGSIRAGGEDVAALLPRRRATLAGYLAQGGAARWPMTVFDIVAIGRLPFRVSSVRLSPGDEAAVTEVLAETGLTAFANRRIDALSEGERARAMIARLLVSRAPLLLADEPVAALDPYHQLQCLELLRAAADRGAAVVAVLHNLSLAAQFAGQAVLLCGGHVAACGLPGDVFTPEQIESVYRIRPMPASSPCRTFGPMWERTPNGR
jgi:iron complex transport system ATP-binding protein